MGLNQGPDHEEKKLLINLAYSAGVIEDYLDEITSVTSYEEYQKLLYKLEDLQPGIDQIDSPRVKDVIKHFNRFI